MAGFQSYEAIHLLRILYSLGFTLLVGGLSWCVYALWFHPLARYPGPKSWALTRVPYFLALISGDYVSIFHGFHQKYGPIIRVGPNELCYADPEAWQDIYGIHSQAELFRLNHMWYVPQKNGVPSMLSAPEPDHTRIRRSMTPAFSDGALRDQEDLIQSYVDTLVKQLHVQCAKGSLNIVDWFNYVTFDITGDLAFADTYDSLTSPQYRGFVAEVVDSFKQIIWLAASPYIPGLQFLVYLFTDKNILKQHRAHFMNTQQKVHKRLKFSDEGRTDFMMYLRRNRDKNDMTVEEIESTFALLVAAGTETTATTLAACVYMLLDHPDALERLTRDVRSVFESENQITADSTSKLDYLNAIIDETLRLCPPLPGVLPRVVPPGGALVCGDWLAGGTHVSTVGYAMTHSSLNFSNPDDFIPERWLPATATDGKSQPVHEQKAFRPFSHGSRSCIGKNLAYLEMRLVLAKLLWNFDLSGKTPRRWNEQKSYIFWEKQPLMVQLAPVHR